MTAEQQISDVEVRILRRAHDPHLQAECSFRLGPILIRGVCIRQRPAGRFRVSFPSRLAHPATQEDRAEIERLLLHAFMAKLNIRPRLFEPSAWHGLARPA